MSNGSLHKTSPLSNNKITPLALAAQLRCQSHYIKSTQIAEIALEKYNKESGRGITYQDLIDKGLVLHKRQAQGTLKYHLRKGTLFTLRAKRPQQYYSSTIRSQVLKNGLQMNTPIDLTGIGLHLPLSSRSKSPLSDCLEHMVSQTLEGYVVPLLPQTPLFIHNMHFKTRVTTECYKELDLPYYKKNHGKYHTEIIGNTHVEYVFYASGTVAIHTRCSNNPYKLETEDDRSRIMVFFGHVRDRLIVLLADKHERIVPDIMEWTLTACDLNKDVKVSDLFHFSAIKVQVKHLDHVFRVYIKSMGKDTVCRVEEFIRPKQRTVMEVINDTFDPTGRVEKQIIENGRKMDEQDRKISAIDNMVNNIARILSNSQQSFCKDSLESKYN